MAAPLGNQFWKARSSYGREPKFKTPADLWKACVEYFEWNEDNPLYEAKAFPYQGEVTIQHIPKLRAMTFGALSIFIDVDYSTWRRYAERDGYRDIVTRVEIIIKTQKFTGAAAELLNPNIIARDLGLADKSELQAKVEASERVEVYLPDNGMDDGSN